MNNNLIARINRRVFCLAVSYPVHINFDTITIDANEHNGSMIGEVGEVAGRRDGFGDSGFADVKLTSGGFDFATDIVNTVPDVHGDGEVGIKFGYVEVVDLILQFARRSAGSP